MTQPLLLRLSSGAATDVGRVRTGNEDAYGLFGKAGVWCVADGMGGGDDGEIASAEAVRATEACAQALAAEGVGDAATAVARLRTAISAASRAIWERAVSLRRTGCGTTFVALVTTVRPSSEAHALHAGDSRLYRIRAGSIRCITRDHSFLRAAGVRSETELNPMFRNMIHRAVGIESDVTLDDTPFSLKPGDRVILCSDGLNRMLSDAEILSTASAQASPEKAARALVAAANAAGGLDNVTAVVVDARAARPGRLRRIAAAVLVALLLAAAAARALFVGRGSGTPQAFSAATDSARTADVSNAERLYGEADRLERQAERSMRWLKRHDGAAGGVVE